MPKVRSGASSKWVKRAQVATEDYVAGVQNPRTDWQTATVAAAPVQAAAVQAAIQRGAYQKGVARAGTQKWQQKAISKGSARFAGGVSEAQGDYEQAVAPYLQTIEATQLPPRGPKGDPKNIQRVVAIATALRKKKESMG